MNAEGVKRLCKHLSGVINHDNLFLDSCLKFICLSNDFALQP